MPQVISAFGLVAMILIAWLCSSHRSKLNWRIILGGLGLQFALAVFVLLEGSPGRAVFQAMGTGVEALLGCVEAGSSFLFNVNSAETEAGRKSLLSTFALGVLPTVIFFSALMSVLYYIGVMQLIVTVMAKVMQVTLKVSGAEALAASANVFVGHTEAPLVVKPFISSMTKSELNAMMVGGFATITGGLLAVYAGMGIDPGHLITASVISAPAALLIAKIMQPETETPATMGSVEVKIEQNAANVIEAAAAGATDGMKLALNVGAMLIAFLALIAMCDGLIGWAGSLIGYDNWSLSALLGYAFYPLAWLMGIEGSDCLAAGELLGKKMVANEFIAYDGLGKMKDAGELQERSIIILTYALSGFSNLGAIGIQIGGIGGLAPDRRSDLAKLGFRAMIGGTLACCMTACIAGVLTSPDVATVPDSPIPNGNSPEVQLELKIENE